MPPETYVEMEGGLLRIFDRTLIGEYPIEDAMPHLEYRVPVTSPVLPSQTVLFHYDESNPERKKIAVVVQMDPHIRTLNYGYGDGTHKLSIPYTVFVFQAETGETGNNWAINDRKIFWSNKPVTSFKDVVIPALTPNIYDDGRVCGGGQAAGTRSLKDQIDKFVNEWYLIDFSEVNHNRRNAQPYMDRTFKKWEAMTKTNPAGWKEWDEFNPEKTNQQMHVIEDVIGKTLDRNELIVQDDGIPPLQFHPTFGSAEEWYRGLNDTQKERLKAAIVIADGNPPAVPIDPEAKTKRRILRHA